MESEAKHKLPLLRIPRFHGLFSVFLLIASAALCDYPRIEQLNSRDVLFKQLQSDLQAYFQAESRLLPDAADTDEFPRLRLFSYRLQDTMDLFSLSARLNLPYDCIATLNGLDNPAAIQSVEVVLIQQFTLLIGPSVYSLITILTTLLIFSGLGSRMSTSFGDQAPFPNTGHPIADTFDFGQIVGRQEDRPAFGSCVGHQAEELLLHERVQSIGRFVKDQQRSPMLKCEDDGQLLFVAM